MAFVLPKSVFVHIPKTGGQWVVEALKNAGLTVDPLGVVHTTPDEINHEQAFRERRSVFAMVRHPLSWYQSMWAHRTDEEWEDIDDTDWFTDRWVKVWAEFTKFSRADEFGEYVRRCCARFPDGFVSMLYDAYTDECTFVGKQEQLVDDLIRALALAGEQFDTERIRTTTPRNVRGCQPRRLSRSAYTPELMELVMSTEARAIERFGYQRVPEGSLLAADAPTSHTPRVVVGGAGSLGSAGPRLGVDGMDDGADRTCGQLPERRGHVDGDQAVLRHVGEKLERPLIIISAPRAGSTLLYEILQHSPDFWNLDGESHSVIESIPHLRPEARDYDSHRLVAADAAPETRRALRAAFIGNLQDRDGRKYVGVPPAERPAGVRFVEKTPRNALRVAFLNKLFPDGLFVFLHRDPRENISSIMEAWRAPGFWQFRGDLPGWDREEWCMLLPPGWREMKGRSLEEIAAFQWRASNELAINDLAEIPSHRWVALDFADLVERPASVVEALCSFSGTRYDDRLRAVSTAPLRPSGSTVTPPAAAKWKRNADAVGRVLPSVAPVVDRIRTLRENARLATDDTV